MGSLTSSFIPAGRLRTGPLSPRASSCRIGSRRSERTRCLRGKRGGRAVGCGGRVASPLAHDKGYYHACLGRSRKLAFGHIRRLEPQPRGAVTRRAVAQRRSRASGLTRPLAEAIRGFDSGLGLILLSVRLPRSAAVWWAQTYRELVARLAGRLVRHQRAYRWFRPVTEPIRYRDSREAVPAAFRPAPLQIQGRRVRGVAFPQPVAEVTRADSYHSEEAHQRAYQREPRAE